MTLRRCGSLPSVLAALLVFFPVLARAATCPTLSVGSTDPNVTVLQKFLYSAYSNFPTPTGYFGSVTQLAVKEWQSDHGISATGTVGSVTAAAMHLSCISSPVSSVPSTASSSQTGQARTLTLGLSGFDVLTLQQFLAKQGLLLDDDVTSYFGQLTQAAVEKFQTLNGIVSSGAPSTTGYGAVGPRTRAVIAEMTQTSNVVSATSSPAQQSQHQSASKNYTEQQVLAFIRQHVLPSVVQIDCADVDGGPEAYEGSGLYYLDPTTHAPSVATNAHVVLGSDGKFHGCNVYFPNPIDGSYYDTAYAAGQADVYNTDIASIDGQEVDGLDYAVLTLTGSQPNQSGVGSPFPPQKEDGFAVTNAECDDSDPNVEIGDPVYALGYPAIGGQSVTLTNGVISGFEGDFNEWLKTSATINHGSSGGIAIGANNACLYGIPSNGTETAGDNLGFLISYDFISKFLQNLTGATTYVPPDSSVDPQTYLTQTYSFPDFTLYYPAQWTVQKTPPDSHGFWIVAFTSPSEGALDNFSDQISVTVAPNTSDEFFRTAIGVAVNNAPSTANQTVFNIGTNATQTYGIASVDSTTNIQTFTLLFRYNTNVYKIDAQYDTTGYHAADYPTLLWNIVQAVVFKGSSAVPTCDLCQNATSTPSSSPSSPTPSATPAACDFGTPIGNGECRGFLTSGTSWTVPLDWNSANNDIEALGAGGGGTNSNGIGNGGGGGGGYGRAEDVSLTPGATVAYQVGTGISRDSSATTNTYLCNATDGCASLADRAVVAGAQGGSGGESGSGGSGGAASASVGGMGGSVTNPGAPYAYSGGSGGSQVANGQTAGGGGGGAAGPYGDGNNGIDTGGPQSFSGGTADGGRGGSGGNANGGPANNGTEWDANHGSGGGGGGAANGGTGGTAGNYGGGAGGSGLGGSFTTGSNGIIVITYAPASASTARAPLQVQLANALTALQGALQKMLRWLK
jgi:peptidoglycan hydrolase-like protein with peptidoglycan-binding domain